MTRLTMAAVTLAWGIALAGCGGAGGGSGGGGSSSPQVATVARLGLIGASIPANMTLVEAPDGDLYGTTSKGGGGGAGMVFKVSSQGTLSVVYQFCPALDCPDGGSPADGLVLAGDGNFYGTTTGGGANNAGTVFKMTPAGVLTTLYSFCAQKACPDGAFPGPLIQASDGNFYGAASTGGISDNPVCPEPFGCGTVFKITPTGVFSTLHQFCAEQLCLDGAQPGIASNPSTGIGLIQASDGNLYGTTQYGGGADAGEIFRVTLDGTLSTFYSFPACSSPCTLGAHPTSVTQGEDGNFYGVAQAGANQAEGSIFRITVTGVFTVLYNFSCAQENCPDGAEPNGLTQATDGNFYGTTASGGIANCPPIGPNSPPSPCGTIFRSTPGGTFTSIYQFPSMQVGWSPTGSLLQASSGILYGVTVAGGSDGGDGIVFSVSAGLPPP